MSDPYRNRPRDRGNSGMLWGTMAVIALLVIGGLFYALRDSGPNTASTPSTTTGTATTGSSPGTGGAAGGPSGSTTR